MNKRKTNRLLKGIIGTTVALSGLTACSSSVQDELLSVPEETNANPQTSPTEPPPSPEEADCETWTWDEEAGVYQCAEEGSENQAIVQEYFAMSDQNIGKLLIGSHVLNDEPSGLFLRVGGHITGNLSMFVPYTTR